MRKQILIVTKQRPVQIELARILRSHGFEAWFWNFGHGASSSAFPVGDFDCIFDEMGRDPDIKRVHQRILDLESRVSLFQLQGDRNENSERLRQTTQLSLPFDIAKLNHNDAWHTGLGSDTEIPILPAQPAKILLAASCPKLSLNWKARLGQIKNIEPKVIVPFEINPTLFAQASTVIFEGDISGLEFLKLVKANPATQHIATMVIAPAGQSQRSILAQDLGADDVMLADFTVREANLRLAAVLGKRPENNRLSQIERMGLRTAYGDPFSDGYNQDFSNAMAEHFPDQPIIIIDIPQLSRWTSISEFDQLCKMLITRMKTALAKKDTVARVSPTRFIVHLDQKVGDCGKSQAEHLEFLLTQYSFAWRENQPAIWLNVQVGLKIINSALPLLPADLSKTKIRKHPKFKTHRKMNSNILPFDRRAA